MSQGTIQKVWDGSGDTSRGLGHVVRSFRMPGTVQGTLPEGRDGSRGPSGGPEWFGRSSMRFGTGREVQPDSGMDRRTIPKV